MQNHLDDTREKRKGETDMQLLKLQLGELRDRVNDKKGKKDKASTQMVAQQPPQIILSVQDCFPLDCGCPNHTTEAEAGDLGVTGAQGEETGA